MSFPIFVTGMGVGLSLIIAIGAQNAFVLRQGLRGAHVLAVCLTCAASDALLILAGVAGFGKVSTALPWLVPVMRYGGAAFLFGYGALSLHSAFRSRSALAVGEAGTFDGLGRTLLTCLAITWLNPHVYLDTVVLLGAVSTQFPGNQAAFAAGAITGSFVFFLRSAMARPGCGLCLPDPLHGAFSKRWWRRSCGPSPQG